MPPRPATRPVSWSRAPDINARDPGTLLVMRFRRRPPERNPEPVWLTPWSPPVPAPVPRRRRRLNGGSSSLLLVIAVAAIATGSATVALGVAGSTSGAPHPKAAKASANVHRKAAPVLAPIVIPPAPSTSVPAPAIDASAPAGPSPAEWGAYVRPAVPALINSAPSVITDPSVVATALVPTSAALPGTGRAQALEHPRQPELPRGDAGVPRYRIPAGLGAGLRPGAPQRIHGVDTERGREHLLRR